MKANARIGFAARIWAPRLLCMLARWAAIPIRPIARQLRRSTALPPRRRTSRLLWPSMLRLNPPWPNLRRPPCRRGNVSAAETAQAETPAAEPPAAKLAPAVAKTEDERPGESNDAADQPADEPSALKFASARPEYFVGWPKPKLALVISGLQNGYLEPCGCAGLENQKGGLSRRHALLKQLAERGWPLAAVDVGGQVRRFGRQAEVQYTLVADALKQMGYSAVAFGADDLRLSAGHLLSSVVAERTRRLDLRRGQRQPVSASRPRQGLSRQVV